jgi:signal transduction histidine kinase
VTLVVSDQGIGIPPDDQEHVFETFHRASNVTHIGGLGLGLKIVRDYVTLHGGTISVRSQEGQGSMFIVRLPVSYEQPQPAAAPGFGINS